jgi:hypothetical protein
MAVVARTAASLGDQSTWSGRRKALPQPKYLPSPDTHQREFGSQMITPDAESSDWAGMRTSTTELVAHPMVNNR